MAKNNNLQTDGVTNNGNMGITGIVKVAILPNLTRYIIYSDGRVYNRETDTYLNEGNKKNRYLVVTLKDDTNNRVTRPLHKLIYEAFIGEVPQGMQINHIDENKANNLILFDAQGNIVYSNLEAVTPRENCNHGTRNQRIKATETGKKRIKQSFTVITEPHADPSNKVVEEFNSITAFITAYPEQNRLTWNYRLYTSTTPKKMYIDITPDAVVKIIPTSEHYQQRLEAYNQKKGEQA